MRSLGAKDRISNTYIPRFLLLRWDFGEKERVLERGRGSFGLAGWRGEGARVGVREREREQVGLLPKGKREWLVTLVGPTC